MLAFVFGGLRVKSDFQSAQQLSRAADTVLVIRPVVEYNLAVQRLAAAESVGGGGVIQAITRYESAAADLRIAMKAPSVPQSVKASAQSALGLGQAVRSGKTRDGFSDVVIDKSGNIATLMSSAVADLGLSDDSASAKIVVALQDTIAAQRALTGQQLHLANTNDSAATLRAIGQVGAETAALSRLQSAGVVDTTQVRQLLNDNGRRGATLQQENVDKAQIQDLGAGVETSNKAYSDLTDTELTWLEQNLRARAAAHRTDAFLNAIVIVAALVAALALVFALMRSLLGPIRVVRQGALEVANKRLPEAVAAMRDGEDPPEFVAIPVYTTEEMGQLARAVDDLHTQALSLAGDQARLRVQVGHMFETLSRRSTSLIDQQLSLIERLESDEEDPKRLQSLFRLDHLAARMRRNSDSLLVLAGTSTRRGASGSVSVSDAVRAAVSEVENYERIDIGDTSDDQVLGSVGSDLIHLIAEVVDNALAYSPPTTRVTIRGARTPEGGLLIEVADRGLGMPPRDLAALNDRLAHGGDITADTARRMGLFVVGSLAKRHGIAVRLRRNGDETQGITVSVHLPATLLADSAVAPQRQIRAAAAAATEAEAVAPAATPVSAVGGTTKAGLPARVRGASGATPSPLPGAAKKVLPTRTPGAHGPGTNGIPPAVKPVIAAADPGDPARPAVNGHDAAGAVVNASDAPATPRTNGSEAHAPGTNGTEAHAAERNGKETSATGHHEDAGVAADSDLPAAPAPTSSSVLDPEPVGAADTVDSSEGADSPAAVVGDEAATGPESTGTPQTRSAAGLPVRKPRATGITEYREFADAPSAGQDEVTQEQPSGKGSGSGKGGRLSGWLPGRGKAQAEAARAQAEAESYRMPSNLSAWLDHRAKLAEVAKPSEASTSDLSAGTDRAGDAQDAQPQALVEESELDARSTEAGALHVPDEWLSEATSDAPAQDTVQIDPDSAATPERSHSAPQSVAVDPATVTVLGVESTVLPTRVPGATASPDAQSVLGEPVPSVRPAMRAHNTSFFGARRARGTAAPEPQSMQPLSPEGGIQRDAQVQEVPDEQPTQVMPEPAGQAEAVTDEPGHEQAAQPEPVQERADEPERVQEQAAQPEPVQQQAVQAERTPGRTPRSDDTPIFRAMMSSWLTEPVGSQSSGGSWSTSEADRAWSAAARIEETVPVQESPAGLPQRRPGSLLVPGAVEEPSTNAAPAASRRDPETIRRNLNRHQRGVSTARTENQDGTHREEADVHH